MLDPWGPGRVSYPSDSELVVGGGADESSAVSIDIDEVEELGDIEELDSSVEMLELDDDEIEMLDDVELEVIS